MDEWVEFAEEQKLDVTKNAIYQEIAKKPRIVYKLHEYMKAGSKRPSQIDPELWRSKSPENKDFDKEITDLIQKNKELLATGEKERV